MYALAQRSIHPWDRYMIREDGDNYDLHNPHDTGYKHLLSMKENMVDLLQGFIKEPWVERIDPSRLTRVDKSYILPDFSKQESDLVYRLELEGEEIYFYVLLELQSSVDQRMPYRLLMYMTEIWRDVDRQSSTGGNTRRLPVILPIVLYNGRRPWTASLTFRGMMEDSAVVGNTGLLDFSYTLIDVNRCGKLELLQLHNVMAAVFLMEQSRQVREILKHLRLLSEHIKLWTPTQCRQFLQWVEVFLGRDLPEQEKQDLHVVLEEINPEEVEQMISNLELVMKEARWKYRMEGLQEGEQKGLQKGLEKGLQEGEQRVLKIARRMLQQGLPLEQVKSLTDLTDEQLSGLKL